MYTEETEIYSDAPNRVVLRVPWRSYPGALIQGDQLIGLSGKADRACRVLLKRFLSEEPNLLEAEGLRALLELRDDLRSLLKHYQKVTHWKAGPSSGTTDDQLRSIR